MYIGAHVSIRNGYLGAARLAYELGATAYQYFPKNPRSLQVKQFDERDAAACRQFCQQHDLRSIAHTSYPTNLAAEDGSYRMTLDSVRNDLAIAEACGSIGVVVHFGQYKGKAKDPLYGYRRMIAMLNDILASWSGQALLLIENNVGQGNPMGMTMEELTQVRSLIDAPEKVGFCLDTCHAFASTLWQGDNWAEVVARARELHYLEHVKAIHLNDSVFPHRSFRDRHANIGKGLIPQGGLQELLSTQEFQQLPVILETPHPPGQSHKAEIEYVNARLLHAVQT